MDWAVLGWNIRKNGSGLFTDEFITFHWLLPKLFGSFLNEGDPLNYYGGKDFPGKCPASRNKRSTLSPHIYDVFLWRMLLGVVA